MTESRWSNQNYYLVNNDEEKKNNDEEMMSHTYLPLPQSMIYSEFTHTLEHVYLCTIQNGTEPIVSFQLSDSNIILLGVIMLQSYIQYGPPIVFCIQYNPTYCQWLQVVPNLGKNEAGAGIPWFIVVHSTALCRFLLLFILQIESFW